MSAHLRRYLQRQAPFVREDMNGRSSSLINHIHGSVNKISGGALRKYLPFCRTVFP